ncbi:hypothetical protein PIB30_079048 [Stylosanthes scabra]|uniref:Uncharacterized protein n=1 Tax=Stylosanthes scabra TaxID=79078 RepID=A0ABU6SS90_9FABA|nr:hypothetical protein [Stylosanthes scabra]
MFGLTRIVRTSFQLSLILALRRWDTLKEGDASPPGLGPSRRASPTSQYYPLSPVSRLRSPPSLSKMVPPTQDLEGARPLRSWELIPPSMVWMYEGDEVEGNRAVEDIPTRVDDVKGSEEGHKEEVEEEEEADLEEDPSEEEMSAIPRAMDVDIDKDYLQYLEELRHHPDYSPVHSSLAFAQNPSDDARSPSSDAHNQPSFDLSGVWPPQVGPRFNRLRSERKWLKRERRTRKSRRKAWRPNSDAYAYAPRLMCVRIAKTWAEPPSWNWTLCVHTKTPYAYAPEAEFEAYK